MLKVKRPVYTQKKKKNNKHETEINEIKNAIKNMYLTNQKSKKSLNDYSQLVTKIRNEYNILVKENQALKTQLEQYKNYYNANIVQRQKKPDVSYRKRKPNYRYSYHNDEDDDDDEDDELKNNYYIPKKKPPKKKSFIKILLTAMNHLHPLKMKKKLMMKLGKKMMMRFTKLEKLKSNSQEIQKQKL